MPVADLRSPPARLPTAHERFCFALCLATAACFGVPGLVLAIGTAYMPAFLWAAVVEGYSRLWGPPAVMVFLGWCGTAAVVRLLHLIGYQTSHDRWRLFTVLGLGLGATAVTYMTFDVATGRGPGGPVARIMILAVMVFIPLLCTLHLCYLARRPLFYRSSERDIA